MVVGENLYGLWRNLVCFYWRKSVCFILPFTAGDGKTSILVQVLKMLDRLDAAEGLFGGERIL